MINLNRVQGNSNLVSMSKFALAFTSIFNVASMVTVTRMKPCLCVQILIPFLPLFSPIKADVDIACKRVFGEHKKLFSFYRILFSLSSG